MLLPCGCAEAISSVSTVACDPIALMSLYSQPKQSRVLCSYLGSVEGRLHTIREVAYGKLRGRLGQVLQGDVRLPFPHHKVDYDK